MLNITKADIREVERMVTVAEAVYEAVKDLNRCQFMMTLATVIDEWAARHKLTQKETFEILEMLAAVQKQVHKAIGPATAEEKVPDKHKA